jgi:hypothetical protein
MCTAMCVHWDSEAKLIAAARFINSKHAQIFEARRIQEY